MAWTTLLFTRACPVQDPAHRQHGANKDGKDGAEHSLGLEQVQAMLGGQPRHVGGPGIDAAERELREDDRSAHTVEAGCWDRSHGLQPGQTRLRQERSQGMAQGDPHGEVEREGDTGCVGQAQPEVGAGQGDTYGSGSLRSMCVRP